MNTMARKHYTEADYEPYVGKSGQSNTHLQPLPNAKDVDPLEFLNDLAAFGHMWKPVWGYAVVGDPTAQGYLHKQWTQFFLNGEGGGHAVTYGRTSYKEQDDGSFKAIHTPIVKRFAICKHEKEEGAGANHARGWHPGHCRLCGMDMSYDSGD